MDYQEAVALQRELAARVRLEDDHGPVRLIAGVDVSMARFALEGYAAIVLLSWPELEPVEVATVRHALEVPYIPGLLSFRELPLVLRAWEKLKRQPDLVVVDGHGVAHPRGLGIAAHLGVTLDLPALGCGKSILVGRYHDLGATRGSRAPLVYRDRTVGWALRTKDKVNPVFVSAGHRLSHASAVRWVLDTGRGYRLPEPTRRAHLAANEARVRGDSPG